MLILNFIRFKTILNHKIMIENHHNLMIWEDDVKFIFFNLLTTSSSTIFFFKDFYGFHLWLVLKIIKLSLVYYLMIKSSIIRKILIPKFFLIGELRAALMLLHIITNNYTINFIKVDDIFCCKGDKNKVLLISISSKHQFTTFNFLGIFWLGKPSSNLN